MKTNIAFVVMSLLASTAANADEMTLVKSADPTMHQYAGHQIDVLGIAPGMSQDNVRKLIEANYGTTPSEKPSGLVMQYRSVSMKTQEYVSRFSAKKERDSIEVYFATPSTGGGVVGIHRTVSYPDATTAPSVDAVFDQLDKKYGVESVPNHWGVPGLVNGTWMFNANAQIQCDGFGCGRPFAPLEPSSLQSNMDSMSQGQHLLINASVSSARTDPTRVSELEIVIEDKTNKVKTLSEAFKQIQTAAQDAYAKTAVPQAGPKL